MTKHEGVNFNADFRKKSRLRVMEDRSEGDWMIRSHYLNSWPGVVTLSLILEYNKNDKGIIVFALPPHQTIKRYGGMTWELARLWVDESMPRNTESWVIGKSIRFIKRNRKDVLNIVSYADPSQSHQGAIYKATNFENDGMTDQGRKTPRKDYVDPQTGKKYSRKAHVPNNVTPVLVPRISKHRYVMRIK